ncbi:MAG: TlpA family protein disulfide reductase [Gemmataceae bacterium]|nr:TlpA family protein disulfide reductase [Gemmataceae bacterium]
MATPRITIKALATLTLWGGFGLAAKAQPPALTVEQAFAAKPRQPGVSVPTPPADQLARYRVAPIPGQQAGSNMGYKVVDAQNRPVRQFVTYDNKNFNILSYYADGQEVYRETFPPSAAEPHSYRWLGANGGKWGIDRDKNGTIDEWAVISPEEVGQELLAAVIAKDPARLNALLPTDEDLKALRLPAAEAARIKEKAAGAAKRLAEAAAALNLSPEARFIHLEAGAPHATPGDSFGSPQDLTVHKNATVLIEDKGKTHFLQTGELLQVGRAWKVVEGPAAGHGAVTTDIPGGANAPVVTAATQELVNQLDALDKTANTLTTPEKQAEYHAKRVAILEQIVQKLPADKQADWVRLLIDSLAAGAEAGQPGNAAHKRLQELNHALAQNPKGPLAPYSAFRLLVAENGMALAAAKPGEIPAIQERWRAGLEGFINAYPQSEDAGEAVLRLAMAFEFTGKDGEAKAKEWYGRLVKNYAQHPQAAKAAGAVRRLDGEGQPLALQGPVLGGGQQFSAGQLAGKPVVVYYWASWSNSLREDAKKLGDLATAYGPKGLQIVTVNLDDDAKAAAEAARTVGLPGTHLHAPGGLDGSPLAAGYGVMVVPHLIVAGKDGKIVNRNAQLGTLDDEVKRLVQ